VNVVGMSVIDLVIPRAGELHRQAERINVLLTDLPQALEVPDRRNGGELPGCLKKLDFRWRTSGVL
jgi:hypothetical protein